MHRKAFAAAIAVAAVMGGAAISPAAAAPQAHAARQTPPTAEAVRQAIAGLPAADATAAQVRLGGQDGHWLGVSGEADIRTHQAPKGDERFRAGSITKAFTAAVALQLIDEGKLSLDGTVQQYLPGLLPANYPDVQVKQLLNYTSGLPSGDMPGDFDWQYQHRFTSYDHRELVQSGFGKPMEFAPGTQQHYTNIGYNVLGLLIEKVTGQSYEKQVRERVINRAGLKDTYSAGNDPQIHGRHTHGYQLDKGKLMDVSEWNQSVTWASGDLVTTTADLERFTTALFRGRVVPQPELKLMFQVPDVPAYGGGKAAYTSGLARIEMGGKTYYGKTGNRYGYLNGFAATENLSSTLVYSVNATDAKADVVHPTESRIIAAALGPVKKK
ncbi:D-alanyl-D-alanine carboxypeptidase [Streptomyces olivoverticillatus]|uniref:D-alanyl-D-alanine carboxypeptidase n=1 Tax=Streptomyces olivoverticillatus TaxID=66427 RepID=A0A7W7LKT5_9ACTN|nr:serine hydrolase domain-containing protein [Streptomyces olivoverticillatus]MBB4892089.1 D-alanyl-D-alanine carboxypeptidase [Streptomyces olivoverticillatus]